MFRIIQGIEFEGHVVPDAWDVRIWEKNGHREISARKAIEWREIGPLPGGLLEYPAYAGDKVDSVADDAAERAAECIRKAAKRAQTMCRRVIKSEGFNELLTLTYRENQPDRALCKEHFKIWFKRMKRTLGEFRFCASFEVQERGSMHVHIACHKLPKHADYKGVKIEAWKLGTKIWRSIVGDDNGLCFVGGKTKFGGGRRNLSLGKMAAYVSKYIMKDYADSPAEKNRYSRSNGADIPTPTRVRLAHLSLRELIEVTFQCDDGEMMVSHRVGHWGDSYWLCTEPIIP